MLGADQLSGHPYLGRLGPDVLDEAVDAGQLFRRLDGDRYRRRAFVRLLQDQGVLAGMGTYLCCEALHVAGVHPRQRPVDLSPEKLRELAGCCLTLARRSYRTGGITNELRRASQMERAGVAFEDRRFHVYRREGLPCYRCGAPVLRERMGGQSIYFCGRCQSRIE